MSIRVEYSEEIDQPFVAIQIGEHIKVYKNPKLTAYMPYWLQECLLNDALRQFDKPRPGVTSPIAEVIDLDQRRAQAKATAGCRRVEAVQST